MQNGQPDCNYANGVIELETGSICVHIRKSNMKWSAKDFMNVVTEKKIYKIYFHS